MLREKTGKREDVKERRGRNGQQQIVKEGDPMQCDYLE